MRKVIGAFAVPEAIQWTSALPKTRSGKILRRLLRKVATGAQYSAPQREEGEGRRRSNMYIGRALSLPEETTECALCPSFIPQSSLALAAQPGNICVTLFVSQRHAMSADEL